MSEGVGSLFAQIYPVSIPWSGIRHHRYNGRYAGRRERRPAITRLDIIEIAPSRQQEPYLSGGARPQTGSHNAPRDHKIRYDAGRDGGQGIYLLELSLGLGLEVRQTQPWPASCLSYAPSAQFGVFF
jgi:hypothetical protein